MEKMDSESKCQHPRKVFAAIAQNFLNDPPFLAEAPYICRDCGHESVGIMSMGDHQPTYIELKAKKARGGFNRGR